MSLATRPFDIIVYGATGFSGTLVANYLSKQSVKFAIAGRNKSKLEELQRNLQKNGPLVSFLVADIGDLESFQKLTAQTKVLIQTAGPFSKYGDIPVRACLNTNTDYCDITGESLFVRNNIDRYEEVAKEKKVLIVSTCGFDSVPSDIAVLHAVQTFRQKFTDASITEIDNVFTMSGGPSGGTLETVLTMMELPYSELSKQANPFFLNPKPEAIIPRDHDKDVLFPVYIQELDLYAAPFVMAAINTRVVRRSAALKKYGPAFSYRETMRTPGLLYSFGVSILFIIGAILLWFPIFRSLARYLLPSGDGPSEEVRKNARFKCELVTRGVTANNEKVFIKTAIKGGDGYEETAKFAAESALLLAFHRNELEATGGVLTPAAAFGEQLLKRLPDRNILFLSE